LFKPPGEALRIIEIIIEGSDIKLIIIDSAGAEK